MVQCLIYSVNQGYNRLANSVNQDSVNQDSFEWGNVNIERNSQETHKKPV